MAKGDKKALSKSREFAPAMSTEARDGACWAQTEDPSGCGAASPSQGRWDPDSLRPALSLGGQAFA